MSGAAATLAAGRALAGGSAADPAFPADPADPAVPVEPADLVEPVEPADPVHPVGRGAVIRQAFAAGMGSAASATRLVARTLLRRHGEPLQVPA